MIVNTGCRSPLFFDRHSFHFHNNLNLWTLFVLPVLFSPSVTAYHDWQNRSFYCHFWTRHKNKAAKFWGEVRQRLDIFSVRLIFRSGSNNRHKWTANSTSIFLSAVVCLPNYWHLGSHNRIIFYHIMTHRMLPLPVTFSFW